MHQDYFLIGPGYISTSAIVSAFLELGAATTVIGIRQNLNKEKKYLKYHVALGLPYL
jgi:hypothetical protein